MIVLYKINQKSNEVRGMKKLISVITALTFVLSSMCISFASFDEAIVKSGTSFNKEWEKVAVSDNKKAKMIYGFDKTLINEDYTYATHSKKAHYSVIWQTGRKKSSNAVAAGKKSKVEIRHKGTSVVYMMFY